MGKLKGMAFEDAEKQTFHDAVANYRSSRDAVTKTADFGAPGGDAERQHRNYQAVHEKTSATLRHLLAEAAEQGVDDIELARAATVSPRSSAT